MKKKPTRKALQRVSLSRIAVFTIPCLSGLILSSQSGCLTVIPPPLPPTEISKNAGGMNLNESHRGKTVVFCPPDAEIFRRAKSKGLLRPGACEGSYMPLRGTVAGLTGDVIAYTEGFSINGRLLPHSTIQILDLGIDMPLPNRFVVPEGQLWLMDSSSSRAFDSRYFGTISASAIQGFAESTPGAPSRADSGTPERAARLD